MLTFLAGVLVGGFLGGLTVAICAAGAEDERQMRAQLSGRARYV